MKLQVFAWLSCCWVLLPHGRCVRCVDVWLSSGGLGLGVVQMRVVMYIFSTYFPCRVRNVWDRRSLCGHCRVILPTYLPTYNTITGWIDSTIAVFGILSAQKPSRIWTIFLSLMIRGREIHIHLFHRSILRLAFFSQIAVLKYSDRLSWISRGNFHPFAFTCACNKYVPSTCEMTAHAEEIRMTPAHLSDLRNLWN